MSRVLLIWMLPLWLSPAQMDILKLHIPGTTVTAGKKAVIRIQISISHDYHVQGNILSDKSLVPTSIEVDEVPGIETGEAVFPPAKKFLLEGTSDSLLVFDGSFEISLPVRTAATVKPGDYYLKARLRFQACDHRTCFFPRVMDFDIPLRVKGRG